MPVTGPLLPDDLDPQGYVHDLSGSEAGVNAMYHVRSLVETLSDGHDQEAVLGLLASAWNGMRSSVLDAIRDAGRKSAPLEK